MLNLKTLLLLLTLSGIGLTHLSHGQDIPSSPSDPALSPLRLDLMQILEAAPVTQANSPSVLPAGPWQEVTLPYLPDPVPVADLDDSPVRWLRVPIPAETKQLVRPAVYIWRHNIRVSVFADDLYIGGTATPMFGQQGIGWNQPLLLDIPLHQAPQHLYIKLEAGPSGFWLSPLMMGEYQALNPAFERRNLLQVQASKWGFGLSLVLAVFSLWLWTKRRQDQLYLQFAGLSLLTAISNAFGFLPFVPIDLTVWLRVVHIAYCWSAFLLISFTIKATGLNRLGWLSRGMLILAAVSTVLQLLVPDQYFFALSYPLLFLGQVATLFLGVVILWHSLAHREAISAWFSIAYIGLIVFSAHDFHGAFLTQPDEFIEGSNWLPLSQPLFIIAFYAHLITRFVGALDESEHLNRNLEARVEASRSELQASYSENQRIEVAAAANAERVKIYRDLHDDVGSKLVTILHDQPNSHSATLAKDALESLRASIYRANHGDQALGEFIDANLAEMRLRVENAGLSFHVESELQNPDNLIAAETAYHVTRILRELISNVLHHAHANNVWVEAQASAIDLSLCVTDDGVGTSPWLMGNGGLATIRNRLHELGGVITLESAEPGMRIIFNVALSPEPAEAGSTAQ